MKCAACQYELPNNAKFCTECGAMTASQVPCRYCGEMNPVDSKFCCSCGKLNQPAPSPSSTQASTNMPDNEDFAFRLTEEKVKGNSAQSHRAPYGYMAVLTENGQVRECCLQRDSTKTDSQGFFSYIWDLAKSLFSSSNEKATSSTARSGGMQSYVLMDLRDLPVVTYSHPAPVPGFPNGVLKFEFWVDASKGEENTVGIFVQRTLQGRDRLTLNEFKASAIQQVTSLIPHFSLEGIASEPSSASLISKDLKRACGISSRCFFVSGKVGERFQIDVSKFQQPIVCGECGAQYSKKIVCCEECGTSMDRADWVGSVKMLQAAGGEQLTLKLSMMIDRTHPEIDLLVNQDRTIEELIDFLSPILRQYQVSDLLQAAMLEQLTQDLSSRFSVDWRGYITNFSVVDIRTNEQDWFFKTNALIVDELNRLEAEKRFLAIDDSELDLKEAAFAITMRKRRQDASEENVIRRAKLDSRTQEATLELEEHALEERAQLAKENVTDKVEQERLAREKDKMLRERDFQRTVAGEDRKVEIDDADHNIGLEKKLAQHDIELANMTGVAASEARRREIGDIAFEKEEEIRLSAKEAAQLGHVEEDLQDRQNSRQLDKLRAMAELEASMTRQDQEFELTKFKTTAELDIEKVKLHKEFELSKVESMKSLDAQQILAMQAAQLANAAGGGEHAANLIKAIAESQANVAGASIKEDLYKQMLDIQSKANDNSLQAQRDVAEMLSTSSQISIQAHKEAAQVAQSTNEKSMDVMSKVATATVSRKVAGTDSEKESKQVHCVNPDCDQVFAEKTPKFCNKCGADQRLK